MTRESCDANRAAYGYGDAGSCEYMRKTDGERGDAMQEELT